MTALLPGIFLSGLGLRARTSAWSEPVEAMEYGLNNLLFINICTPPISSNGYICETQSTPVCPVYTGTFNKLMFFSMVQNNGNAIWKRRCHVANGLPYFLEPLVQF